LNEVTADFTADAKFGFPLDTLRDDRQAEAMHEADDLSKKEPALLALIDGLDEAAIDFHEIGFRLGEQPQAGISGSEVVERGEWSLVPLRKKLLGAWHVEHPRFRHDPDGMRTLILRPPDFYGPTAANSLPAFVLKAARAGKTADVLAPDTTPHEFIFVDDLAPIIADLFERPDAFGTAYNVAGSGTITTREFVRQLLAADGKPQKTRAAGPAILKLMGLFNPLMRELVEMHYLQTNPVLLDDTKLRALLPHLKKTSWHRRYGARYARPHKRPTLARDF
jgi:hypothetical protein